MYNPFKKIRRNKQNRLEKKLIQGQLSSVMTSLFRDSALNNVSSGVEKNSSSPESTPPIIVSLTTHSSRINDVYLTIESLFSQSRKPERVLLWVTASEYSEEDIPAILQKQKLRGLEIRFCEKDLGPYTKFYYTLKEFPKSLILTVDDDLMYPVDLIDQLYRAYVKAPDVIHCHRAHRILTSPNGEFKPYKKWDFNSRSQEASLSMFPTGVGGVLYFPGCFDEEVFNQEAFLALAPNADDVWLKAMSLKKGVLCQRVADARDWSERFIPIFGSQSVKLKAQNKSKQGGNDVKIQSVFSAYDLYKYFK